MVTIPVIGVASGIAANEPGSGEGPQVLAESSFNEIYRKKGLQLDWRDILTPVFTSEDKMDVVSALSLRIALKVRALVKKKQKFLVMGGDHSCAVGTWSGVASTWPPPSPLGLLWIDAHCDAHTPETTETGNIHGMPVASLLGYGDHRLSHLLDLNPKLLPEHLCMIGIRSFEPAEATLLKRLKVRVVEIAEVKQRGFSAVFTETLEYLRKNCAGYGVSLDLDAIDPLDAPGVSTPVSQGISGAVIREVFETLQDDPHFLGLEIAEFNPAHDKNQCTERLIFDLIFACFKGAAHG